MKLTSLFIWLNEMISGNTDPIKITVLDSPVVKEGYKQYINTIKLLNINKNCLRKIVPFESSKKVRDSIYV